MVTLIIIFTIRVLPDPQCSADTYPPPPGSPPATLTQADLPLQAKSFGASPAHPTMWVTSLSPTSSIQQGRPAHLQ